MESRTGTYNIHEIAKSCHKIAHSLIFLRVSWYFKIECPEHSCGRRAEYCDNGSFQTLSLKVIASGYQLHFEMTRIPLEECSLERLAQLRGKMIWWLLNSNREGLRNVIVLQEFSESVSGDDDPVWFPDTENCSLPVRKCT